jgi:ElaB/YqjD/DUF883 family membrane-anchored ribosome-binding protein
MERKMSTTIGNSETQSARNTIAAAARSADDVTQRASQAAHDTIAAAARTAEDVTQRVSDAANDAGAAVRDAVRKVSAAAGEMGEQAVERGNQYRRDVLTQVEKQPATALLIAGVAGFVAGLLLARR